MSKWSQKVKVVSDSFIKPKDEIINDPSKRTYYLSPMDLHMLSSDYMQTGILYRKPCDQKGYKTEVFVQKLKQSFALSLNHFYPLAGRFATETYPDEHACCIYVDCAKGHGARFIHASVDENITDIFSTTDDVHPIVSSFFDLGEKAVNHDGHTRALLSLQVTDLIDGIFIGVCISHAIGDGTSRQYFTNSLSEIFNSIDDTQETYCISTSKPIFQPFFPDNTYGPILKLPFVEPNEFITRFDPAPLRDRFFTISRESMLRLKSKANNNHGYKNEISAFSGLSGLVWKAITRARKLDPETKTNCSLAMNLRPRLVPPIPQEYFGNYFSRAYATCKVGDLLSNDIGYAALLVSTCVKNKDDNAIRGLLRKYCEAPFVVQPKFDETYFGPNYVKIVGSPRSDLYGVGFGLGKPVAIRTGCGNKVNGRVVAFQGPEGVGSVELEICLVPQVMAALEADDEFMSFVNSAS